MILLTAMQIVGDCYRTSRFFCVSAARCSLAFSWAFLFLRIDSGTAMSFLVGTLTRKICQSSQTEGNAN